MEGGFSNSLVLLGKCASIDCQILSPSGTIFIYAFEFLRLEMASLLVLLMGLGSNVLLNINCMAHQRIPLNDRGNIDDEIIFGYHERHQPL